MSTKQQQIVYLVEETTNPSTEYFIAPMLTRDNHRVIHCDFSTLPDSDDLAGSVVIFIRYIPTKWARLIAENRNRIKALVFFMDDDVLDISATAEMPWRYRYKLTKFSARHVHWLRKQGAELWVSTPYLKQKYASWQPKLILPTPPVDKSKNYFRVFYHGSPATHKAEINWLRPVMELVLARNENLCFEIIGGADAHRQYKDLNRVTVVHPMKWPSYQTFISSPGRQIGLAPQLDVPFNRARSYTKFFDIHRCGAVGVFSPYSASADIVNNNIDGLVVELDQSAWAETIVQLANDDAFRNSLFTNAGYKIADLRFEAQKTYVDLDLFS